MPGSLGGLVVSLGLDATTFTDGLTKSQREAQKFAQSFSNNVAAGIIKAQVAMDAFGAAARIAIQAIPDLIDQAGHFQDLAEKTGASAVDLASFSVAAKVASTSIDDVANFSIKMSKNLSTASEESSKTAAALAAIGIPIKDFKQLDPAGQIDLLAKALSKFSDIGGGKAAALEAIAKGGAQILPFLKELEEGTGRVNILTAEQIKRADEFSDAQKRSAATLNVYAQALAVEFAPAITAFKDALTETIKEMLGLNDATRKLPTNEVRTFAEGAALALGHVVDVVDGLIRLYQILGAVAKRSAVASFFSGEQKQSLAGLGGEIDAILQREQFSAKVRRDIAQQRKDEAARAIGPPAPDKPGLRFSFDQTAADRAAQEAKRTLDGQLKALDNFISSEQDILNTREAFLRSYYQDDQIGLRQFFQARRDATDEATQHELAALDEQIQLLREFKAKTPKEDVKIATQTRIDDLTAKRAKLQADSATKAILLNREEDRSIKQLTDSIEQASIALREMQGDSVGAAGAAFDFAHRKILSDLNLLAQSPNPQDQALAQQGQAILSQTRDLTVVRAQLTKATADYNITLEELGIAQQRIDIGQQTGELTTLEALRQKSELAAQYTSILREQLALVEAQAKASGRPEDLIRVKQLQVQLEALAATGDLVAKQFNDIFVTNFADGIAAAVSGTKTLKQAFLDMAKSIEQAITRIAAQNIAESLLKGAKGSGLDPGSFLSKLFGGGTLFGGGVKAGGAGGGILPGDAGIDAASTTAAASLSAFDVAATTSSASLSVFDVSTTTAGLALDVIATSAAAASAALDVMAASAAVSAGGDVAGAVLGALAGGTDFWRGGPALVGENGPEVVNLPRGASVTPTNEASKMFGPRMNFVINVLPGANTKTAQQAAAQTGIAVQRALVRNT